MQDDSKNPADLPSPGRRRFTRGGLAAPVVLSSLVSQPVLGQTYTRCTPSGRWSGNMSYTGDFSECSELGYSPADWKDNASWPVDYDRGTLPSGGNGNATCTTGVSGDTFNDEFGGNYFFTSRVTGGGNHRCVTSYASRGDRPATLLEVLRIAEVAAPEDQVSLAEQLGREAVAALLNSTLPGYPLSADRVIHLFEQVHDGSSIVIDTIGGKTWKPMTVLRYLRSLHTSGNWY